MKKSDLKKIIKEEIKAERKRHRLVEQHLNEDFGVTAAAVMVGILGAGAALKIGGKLARSSTTFVGDFAHAVDQAKRQAEKAQQNEKTKNAVASIAEKFANDSKLAALMAELEKYPYDHKKGKSAKNYKDRQNVLTKINAYVKSKLEGDEAWYLKDVNAAMRKGK